MMSNMHRTLPFGVMVMRYEGFYTDADLPVRPGSKVRITKGTLLRSMHPSRDGPYESGKSLTVTVDHVLNGVSMPAMDLLARRRRYGANDPSLRGVNWDELDHLDEKHDIDFCNKMIPMQNPTVVWAGAGGYWVEAGINDVEIIDFSVMQCYLNTIDGNSSAVAEETSRGCVAK